jgi:hypothetical protein
MRKLRIALTALMLTGLLVSTSGTFVLAATPPEPTYGTAAVDGNSSEWNLAEDGTGDFFADMWRAGRPPGDHPNPVLESKLYLRYDCSTGTLYALVLAEQGVAVLQQSDDAWIRIDGPPPSVNGGSGNDGTPPDFEWVWIGDELRGYEASLSVSTGNHTLDAHIQVFDDDASQTSAAYDAELVIACPDTGAIIINKEASFESERPFPFTSTVPGHENFSLVDDGSGSGDTITFLGLAPGPYTVTELVPSNWALSSIACVWPGESEVELDLSARQASIGLAANETVECTFTNDPDPGTIVIQKFTDPSGLDEFDFSFTDDIASPYGFFLSDGEQVAFLEIEPGSYTVAENDPAQTVADAFSLSELVCEDSDTEGTPSEWNLGQGLTTINLDPGETVTCSFTNKKDEGTAITLASFAAKAGVGAVRLEWETGTEIDNAGFNLYRATAPGGPYTKVNAALIAAEGDPVAGASYSFLDQRLLPGTYYYKLEDVDFNGVTTLHGPVSATVLPRFRRPAYRPTLPGF